MVERIPKNVMLAGAALLALSLAYVAYTRPGYFTSPTYLLGLLSLEVMVLAVWMYRRVFFAVVLVSFLFAGVNLPVGGGWATARWAVLGVGTLVGLLITLKDRNHRFGLFHLIALFAGLTGLISAAVSLHPDVALLKVLSMLLLFGYAATGARVAAVGRENQFFSGLLLGCEILTGFNAVFYSVGIQAMGNPNSLGAVMCVVAPILLWGALLGGKPSVYRRRYLLYGIGMYLVFLSHARAGLGAAIISSAILCIGLRKYKLLLQGTVILLIVGAAVALVRPEAISSTSNALIYKNREEGLLASRMSPWQTAIDNFNEHPWFGMGLGTTVDNPEGVSDEQSKVSSSGSVTAENGSSYLSLLVGVGVVGAIPFTILLLSIVGRVVRTLLFMRTTASALHPAIPLAIVMIAGFVHAAFEDWMFAPGNYICVFFWSLAFVLNDVAPTKSLLSWRWQPKTMPAPVSGIPSAS